MKSEGTPEGVVVPAYDELFRAVTDGESGAFNRLVDTLEREEDEVLKYLRAGLARTYSGLIDLAGGIPDRARRRRAVKRLAMQRDLALRAIKKASEQRARRAGT